MSFIQLQTHFIKKLKNNYKTHEFHSASKPFHTEAIYSSFPIHNSLTCLVRTREREKKKIFRSSVIHIFRNLASSLPVTTHD